MFFSINNVTVYAFRRPSRFVQAFLLNAFGKQLFAVLATVISCYLGMYVAFTMLHVLFENPNPFIAMFNRYGAGVAAVLLVVTWIISLRIQHERHLISSGHARDKYVTQNDYSYALLFGVLRNRAKLPESTLMELFLRKNLKEADIKLRTRGTETIQDLEERFILQNTCLHIVQTAHLHCDQPVKDEVIGLLLRENTAMREATYDAAYDLMQQYDKEAARSEALCVRTNTLSRR
jgi:hypothetical protein